MCKRVTNVLSRKCNGTIEFDIDQNCRIVRIDRYAMEAFIVNFEKTVRLSSSLSSVTFCMLFLVIGVELRQSWRHLYVS